MSSINPRELAQYLDHTLLKVEAKEADILALCDEAKEFGFKTVCIRANWLPKVVPYLGKSGVLPITVISFPQGNDPTAQKIAEAMAAREAGAQEIDMVMNRDWLKAKDYRRVLDDVAAVVHVAKHVPVKVILETSELTDSEKRIACALCKAAGASFVKTSTGFSTSGASTPDVRIMREVVGTEMGVKASGGIRSYEDAIRMIEAGANRLGTSASVAIVKGAAASSGAY